MKILALAVSAAILATGAARAAEGDHVQGKLQGEGITGTVAMEETASGTVLIEVTAEGLPEGEHGFHVHETGKCDSSDGFKSAGGHLARGLEHGIRNQSGPHPGDFPNLHAQGDGAVHAEFFVRGFTLGTQGDQRILDDDGSAVIIHAGADDYQSQPSGESGDRIACAVLESASAN